VMLVEGIYKIINGSTPVRQALGGPIMIAQIAGREAHEGFASVALFSVMLSLELGIINLLPVPMLDGGHILFFLIEGVRGKPLQVRHREIAQQVGLFLLVVLMAFVIFNDISRIVQG
jgi:regulator of sigma E protease